MTYHAPRGGRGIKAEFPTCTMRVPIGMKSSIQSQINAYRGTGQPPLSTILDIIQQYQSIAKNSRDWTMANKLIEEILGSIPPDIMHPGSVD
jgi:hypothetical protein